MNYTQFDVEDFASDERFIEWVTQKTPEEEKFWAVFLAEYPGMKPKIEKARALVVNLQRAERRSHDEKQVAKMWGNIRERMDSPSIPPRRHISWPKLLIAASVTLFVAVAALVLLKTNGIDSNNNTKIFSYTDDLPGYVEQVNNTGSPRIFTLGDGSVVTLENNGRLKYKTSYASDSVREVYLDGNAFFQVTKSTKHFLVHTEELVTEVLGTSFRVKADRKNIVVSVKTGKVSVYSLKKETPSQDATRKGVVLLPNQEVSYEREQESFDKKLIEEPQVLLPEVTTNDFTFDNTAIKDVFKKLEDAYGIEIMFNEDIMKNCFITAPLGSEPLFEKLKIICQTIGASYEVIDAKVIISSSGC